MKIAHIDTNKDVFIIAEIGNNHEGDIALAEEMIALAAEAGAHAVKFQTIIPERLVSISQTDRIKQLSRFQFSYEQFEHLHHVAQKEGILFMSTPFDVESAIFLDPLVPAFKIASGDNNFFPLIDTVAKTGKPLIISSGMTTLPDVKRIKARIETIWGQSTIQQDMAILHCVVSYPTQPEEANLLAIETLKQVGVTVGYSDHTLGIDAAVLSVALGARIIEKHFTIDHHHSDFRDHQLSANPQQLKELVERVKLAQAFLGDGQKKLQPSELSIQEAVRRSIVAAKDLSAGHVLSWEDLSWVRPGNGIKPGEEERLIGHSLKRAMSQGQQIQEQDLQ